MNPWKNYLNRLRFEKVYNLIKDKKGIKILDVGCGRGYFPTLIKRAEYFGIDQSVENLTMAKEKKRESDICHFYIANAENLGFKDNYFDFVVCSEVLEHIKNDERVLKEIYRVTKRGGKFILTVPNRRTPVTLFCRIFGIKRFEKIAKSHLREYTYNEIRKLTRKYGFTLKKVIGVGFRIPSSRIIFPVLYHFRSFFK